MMWLVSLPVTNVKRGTAAVCMDRSSRSIVQKRRMIAEDSFLSGKEAMRSERSQFGGERCHVSFAELHTLPDEQVIIYTGCFLFFQSKRNHFANKASPGLTSLTRRLTANAWRPRSEALESFLPVSPSGAALFRGATRASSGSPRIASSLREECAFPSGAGRPRAYRSFE
jgi:hypothetical protein